MKSRNQFLTGLLGKDRSAAELLRRVRHLDGNPAHDLTIQGAIATDHAVEGRTANFTIDSGKQPFWFMLQPEIGRSRRPSRYRKLKDRTL
jgi:hypothetical protein